MNPSSSYAPQRLSMAIACYRTQGNVEPSEALLQRRIQEYPESAEAGGLAK